VRIGYRIEDKNGLMIRVAFTPTFDREFYNESKYSFGLWGGASIGYSFNTKKNKIWLRLTGVATPLSVAYKKGVC
jgi:hypothetical protein